MGRRPTTPAYYLGRPVGMWIAAFRHTGLHTKAKA
jgi:hypothetical protein